MLKAILDKYRSEGRSAPTSSSLESAEGSVRRKSVASSRIRDLRAAQFSGNDLLRFETRGTAEVVAAYYPAGNHIAGFGVSLPGLGCRANRWSSRGVKGREIDVDQFDSWFFSYK